MLFHILAAFTIIIWGITLISTKILIFNGLSPAGIMLYRFVIAYAVLWIFYPRLPKVKKWKDEAIFFAAGLFGGTIYFLTENTAVGITNTSNVALIVTTAPLLTAFIANFTLKNEPLKRHTFLGSIIALGGVFLIVFNGNFILQLNPAGDLLSFFSALSWAIYSILIKKSVINIQCYLRPGVFSFTAYSLFCPGFVTNPSPWIFLFFFKKKSFSIYFS